MDKREIALRFETPLVGPFDMFFLRNENDKVRIGIREGHDANRYRIDAKDTEEL
jgi:hypothetical protein